ncbi:MAG TPA: cell division protein FtsH, partial [Polyangiaceae bacterium LLY-WYZ-15_(1-7)]|nr:cell division protein FtsH [Polyangiaceae bacterium LLY-WYZ-15_(1-7)]
EIDTEVRRIITEQYDVARRLIEENRDKLDAIANALLERETIGRSELDAIAEGRPLPPPEKIVIPSYEEKKKESKDKRKGSIFQPRPREVPSAG